MKLTPVLVGLTVINLGLVGYQTLYATAAKAAADDGILRGKGLQITDDKGRVRASISLFPASRQPDGSMYPETVLLRLITSEGKPTVKISALEDGAGMSLGSNGPAYAQILARNDRPELNLVGRDGRRFGP